VKKVLPGLLILVFWGFVSQGVAQESFLIKVSPLTTEEVKLLAVSGIKAYAKTADYYLAEGTSASLDYLSSHGISYKVLDDEPEYSLYFFVWAKPGENISKYLDKIKEKATVLEAEGERAIVKGHPLRIEELTALGLSLKLIKKKPLPIKSEEELPFLLKGKALAYDPLIDSIIQKVTTAELTSWVGNLSGENEVSIGGSPETLLTRYTYTEGCDKAAQYLKEQFESLGLTASYDTFTIYSGLEYAMDIVSSPDGNTAWMGCLYSGIWKTTDAGNSWHNINGTNGYELWALAAPCAETLYAVGNYGVILKSIDAGDHWFELNSPTSNYLRGTFFHDSQRGWISGYYGALYLTTDGGQSWTSKNNETTFNLYEITFVDLFNGWVVGTNGKILHTTNRGDTWTSQTSGTSALILGIDFATPTKGWVCGDGGYLRYTTNAGANWLSQTSGTSLRLYMVTAPDSMHAWVAGLDMTILYTNNGGTNWNTQVSNPNYGLYYEVFMLDTLQGWVVGYYDILHTVNGGQNWIQQEGNITPVTKFNVVATLPGITQPGKECLLTAHYDNTSEEPYNYAPGADDNGSGTAAVLTAAHILKDYQFDYTLKFIGFAGEEQGLLGSEAYAEEAQQRGDTILGVYNFDMIAWENNSDNVIELHAGTGASSGALADIMTGVINDYSLPLVPNKITSGATDRSDHASFWTYGYPAILGIEDMTNDFNGYYHSTSDRINYFDFPYFTNFSKAGIASLAILAQPIKPYVKGDANDDGKVTVSDVVYLINYLFKGGTPPSLLEAGDVNCDGKITVSDVVYLINYLFKGGPPPC
jgi:photosystem II stability/assembly factor-like uncharacterized protein